MFSPISRSVNILLSYPELAYGSFRRQKEHYYNTFKLFLEEDKMFFGLFSEIRVEMRASSLETFAVLSGSYNFKKEKKKKIFYKGVGLTISIGITFLL